MVPAGVPALTLGSGPSVAKRLAGRKLQIIIRLNSVKRSTRFAAPPVLRASPESQGQLRMNSGKQLNTVGGNDGAALSGVYTEAWMVITITIAYMPRTRDLMDCAARASC